MNNRFNPDEEDELMTGTPSSVPPAPISNLSFALKNVHLTSHNGPGGDTSAAPTNPSGSSDPSGPSDPSGVSGPASHATPASTAPPRSSRISEYFQNLPTSGMTLFSHRSAPNGFKVAIILTELDIHFHTVFLDFQNNEQRCPEYVQINPNSRVPTVLDHSNDNAAMWESGAIIIYVCQKVGHTSLYSSDLAEQAAINSWIFFQTSGHAPMIGQALHFRYFHSESVPSAEERYTEEVRRIYGVIEMALALKREAMIMEMDAENASLYSNGSLSFASSKYFHNPVWLVGDRITVADLCFVPWNNVVDKIGISLKDEFPEVYKWTKTMMQRPAVIRALKGLDNRPEER